MTGGQLARVELDPADTLGARALAHLGLSPNDPATFVLALLADRYDLDPLLGELAVIKTQGGMRPYVTRDGMLTIAHRSGVFDGMETIEQRESDNGWSATVAVHRKDMSHPFVYSAGCGKGERQARDGNGAEMALARAERRALRRAFNIPTDDGGQADDADTVRQVYAEAASGGGPGVGADPGGKLAAPPSGSVAIDVPRQVSTPYRDVVDVITPTLTDPLVERAGDIAEKATGRRPGPIVDDMPDDDDSAAWEAAGYPPEIAEQLDLADDLTDAEIDETREAIAVRLKAAGPKAVNAWKAAHLGPVDKLDPGQFDKVLRLLTSWEAVQVAARGAS